MNRLPADVAHEVASIIRNAGVEKPHIETVDYVTKQHYKILQAESIAWKQYIGVAA